MKRLAMLAMLILTTGCVDLSQFAAQRAQPALSFERPSAWNCSQHQKLPSSHGVVDCSVCFNATKGVEAVFVHAERHPIAPGASVFFCPNEIVVEGEHVQNIPIQQPVPMIPRWSPGPASPRY